MTEPYATCKYNIKSNSQKAFKISKAASINDEKLILLLLVSK